MVSVYLKCERTDGSKLSMMIDCDVVKYSKKLEVGVGVGDKCRPVEGIVVTGLKFKTEVKIYSENPQSNPKLSFGFDSPNPYELKEIAINNNLYTLIPNLSYLYDFISEKLKEQQKL